MAHTAAVTKNETNLRNYTSWLTGVGILNILRTAACVVSGILCVALTNGAEVAEKVFNITSSDTMSVESLGCATGIAAGVVFFIMAILLFKSVKPGAKKTTIVVEAIAFLSLITTIVYMFVGDGPNISTAISNFMDAMTITAAEYVRRHNK